MGSAPGRSAYIRGATRGAAIHGVDPGVALETGIDEEARRQALVGRAHVADGRPDVLDGGGDHDLLADGSHGGVLLRCRTPALPVRETTSWRPCHSAPASCSSRAR